jgi:Integrase core domain
VMSGDIRRSYLNQRFSGAFSGLSGFLKNRKKWTDRNAVAQELRKLDAYSLHRDVRRKFKRRRIFVQFINEIWAADLKDISTISKWNNGANFVLVVVDALSKKAYTRAIKNKSSSSMVKAFKSIFKEAKAVPHYLFVDMGTEFLSKNMKTLLKKHNITLYHIYSHIKSSFSERFIRTLFTKLERYQTERKTKKIINVLQEFTKSYNSSFHRTIQTTPNSVNKQNENKIWNIIFKDVLGQGMRKRKKPTKIFKVGDIVRISREKLMFEKGCTYFIRIRI